MDIKFKCDDNNFKDIEMFLFSQEYKERPPFDRIILELTQTHKVYLYTASNEFGSWYIVE